MHLFYTPDIKKQEYTLDSIESKHCIKVLRLSIGDKIQLIDGKGGFYTAKIIDDSPKRCTVRCVETLKEYGKRNFSLHIAIAPTKNIVRLEWFLEKATEIGVNRISPILCKHSEQKVIKKDRLLKIIKSALKQSQKFHLPQLDDLVPFNEFVERQGKGFIAHCNDGEKLELADLNVLNKNNCVLIGPEGDFNKVEVAFALKNNFMPISLGDQRLRTETAGLVACHTLSLINRKV